MSCINIFYQSVACLPTLLILFFTEQKFLILMMSSLSIIFYRLYLWAVSKIRYHHSHCHLGFLLCYLLRVLIVLYFTFRSVIYFELIFVKYVRFMYRLIFYFFAGGWVVLAPFVEETIFIALYCLCSIVKDQLTIFVGVCFWALYSVSLIYSSATAVLPLVLLFPYCFGYAEPFSSPNNL